MLLRALEPVAGILMTYQYPVSRYWTLCGVVQDNVVAQRVENASPYALTVPGPSTCAQKPGLRVTGMGLLGVTVVEMSAFQLGIALAA